MTREQKALLIAMIIGDGCVTKQGKFQLKHSIKQKEYLEYKANLVNKILGGKQVQVKDVNNNRYPGCIYYKQHRYFKILRKYLYKEGKKTIPLKALNRLSPQGLAIWWMDDGCLFPKKRRGKIHAWELYLNTYLTKEENEEIIYYFLVKWGIRWKLNRDGNQYRLRCGTQEGRKFLDIVSKYVKQINCMAYKAIEI